MNIILFDDYSREDLFPLTLTRPVGALRIGILTIAEKWQLLTRLPVSYLSPDYLKPRFPLQIADDNFLINAKYIPDLNLWKAIELLAQGESYVHECDLLAKRLGRKDLVQIVAAESPNNMIWQGEGSRSSIDASKAVDFAASRAMPALATAFTMKSGMGETSIGNSFSLEEATREGSVPILFPEDLIRHNAYALEADFSLLTAGRTSAILPDSNRILGNRLFVESGVTSNFATFNTETGPIYLGKNVQIMEGSLIRGPFAILDNSVVKMGTRVYGSTTVGPNCTIGGEIKNSILYGNTRKGHEGYLGDSVLGEWCNLGADTNNSNLKNNYRPVSLYNYKMKERRVTDLTYLGMIMGDYTKSGINASFNTGTVIGMGVNFYGTTLSTPFISDFTWSESGKQTEYRLEQMIEALRLTRMHTKAALEDEEEKMIRHLFIHTATYRNL